MMLMIMIMKKKENGKLKTRLIFQMRVLKEKTSNSIDAGLPSVSASVLLQLFPFGVLLDKNMKVISAGEKVGTLIS